MKISLKVTKKLIPVLAAAMLAVGSLTAAGVVSADPGRDGTSLLAKVAAKLGIRQDALTQAFKDSGIELIDEGVASGRIPADRAEKMKERVAAGNFMPGHRGGHGHHTKAAIPVHEAIAQALGMTTEELRIALASGKTPVQLAEEKGISQAQLSALVLSSVRAQLDQAVTDGKLTQEQAERAYQEIESRINDLLTKVHPMGRGRGPGSGRWHFGTPEGRTGSGT